jgi:hypothetical protein
MDSPDLSKEFGITRASILLELRSLHFPRSFPVDIMHCVLLNVSETLYKLWNQTKLGPEQEAEVEPDTCGYVSITVSSMETHIKAAHRAEQPTTATRLRQRQQGGCLDKPSLEAIGDR